MGRTRASHVLGLLALANLLSYASRNVPFAVYPDLRERFGVDDAALGWLGTAFMLPHALATLPVGLIGDRTDRRRVIALGLVLWSGGGLAGAFAPSYELVVASRVLVGLGTAAVVPVANAILGNLFHGPAKAMALAVFNLGLFVGGVAGFALGAKLGFPIGWIVIAAPGFLLAAVIAGIDVPQGQAEAGSWQALVRDARRVVRIRSIRRLMVATSVMAFAAGGYQSWLLDFLQRDKGMSEDAATTLLGAALMFGLAGVVAGGRVADRLRRTRSWGRVGAIALGMGLTVPFATAAVFAPPGPLLWLVAAGTLFFISWYHGPMAASVDDLTPPELASSAQAVVIFTMHLIGTAPSSLIIGEAFERWGPRPAMLIATGAVGVAALLVTRAFASFADDAHAAHPDGAEPDAAGLARSGTDPPALL